MDAGDTGEPPVVTTDDPTHFVQGGVTASDTWLTSPTGVVHRRNEPAGSIDSTTSASRTSAGSFYITPSTVNGTVWVGFGTQDGFQALRFSNGSQALTTDGAGTESV